MTLQKTRFRLGSYSIILESPTGSLQPQRDPHLPSYLYRDLSVCMQGGICGVTSSYILAILLQFFNVCMDGMRARP